MDDARAAGTRSYEDILSTLRHELGSPLAVLDMVFRTLDEHLDRLPEDAVEVVAAGRRQLSVAQALVEDLRVAGQEELELELERVDLREATEEFVADFDGTVVQERQLQVRVPRSPVPVDLDRRRYGQVLRNLLDNAHKYAPAGEPVAVHVELCDDHAEVWVINSGDGVAPQDTERIFDRYERADDRTSGLGIGLWISRRIARAHGGDLSVTDAPDGPGARFVIELPLAEGA